MFRKIGNTQPKSAKKQNHKMFFSKTRSLAGKPANCSFTVDDFFFLLFFHRISSFGLVHRKKKWFGSQIQLFATEHTVLTQQMDTSNQVLKKCVAAIRHKHFWKSTKLSETVLEAKKRFSVQKRDSSDQNQAKLKKLKKVTTKKKKERKKGFFL